MKYNIKLWRHDFNEAVYNRAAKFVPVDLQVMRDQTCDIMKAHVHTNPGSGPLFPAWSEKYKELSKINSDAFTALCQYKALHHSNRRINELLQVRAHMRGRLHFHKRWVPCRSTYDFSKPRATRRSDHPDHKPVDCPMSGRRLEIGSMERQQEQVAHLLPRYAFLDQGLC